MANRAFFGLKEKANQAISKINLKLEEKLQQTISQLEQTQEKSHKECLQATLDTIAHEIRNPLMALGGFARRLAQIATDDSELKTYAQVVINEASRLERVLKDINEYCQTGSKFVFFSLPKQNKFSILTT
ncbi:MAG: hypothetical protein J7M03_00815 [Candidatus Desulfofervidaceae bacterium]|nr:hypothetical protein [Candidatus Desulfofervidaceae bacterium]